jgi:hypothetical protein
VHKISNSLRVRDAHLNDSYPQIFVLQPPEEMQEVLLSLSYLPSAERLTVVLLKARNLFLPQDKDNIGKHSKTDEAAEKSGTLHNEEVNSKGF